MKRRNSTNIQMHYHGFSCSEASGREHRLIGVTEEPRGEKGMEQHKIVEAGKEALPPLTKEEVEKAQKTRVEQAEKWKDALVDAKAKGAPESPAKKPGPEIKSAAAEREVQSSLKHYETSLNQLSYYGRSDRDGEIKNFIKNALPPQWKEEENRDITIEGKYEEKHPLSAQNPPVRDVRLFFQGVEIAHLQSRDFLMHGTASRVPEWKQDWKVVRLTDKRPIDIVKDNQLSKLEKELSMLRGTARENGKKILEAAGASTESCGEGVDSCYRVSYFIGKYLHAGFSPQGGWFLRFGDEGGLHPAHEHPGVENTSNDAAYNRLIGRLADVNNEFLEKKAKVQASLDSLSRPNVLPIRIRIPQK
jgi:hypothetical protein